MKYFTVAPGGCVIFQEMARETLLRELHRFEWTALVPALREVVRLLESPAWERLTDRDILEVSNYRAVELGGETFFERPYTPGKEAAATLGFARLLGRETVLRDLLHLRDSLGCRPLQ